VELADFEYFTELLNSVSSYALSQGYTVVVMPRVTQAGAKLMNGMPIDGAILIDPTTTDPNLQALERAHIPTIATSRSPDLGRSDYWVDVDYSAATVAVLDHLAAMGAERPALITSSPICWYSMESLSAYNSWMTGRGLQLITSVVSDSLTEGGGYGAAWELFEHDPRPDAIHATLDRLALGALLAAGAAGLRVPEDLLLSSLTDSRAARRAHPPLSAVDLKPARLGREAAGC
jgi:DNA-binding LacI/PurR family transcriptional regulator